MNNKINVNMNKKIKPYRCSAHSECNAFCTAAAVFSAFLIILTSQFSYVCAEPDTDHKTPDLSYVTSENSPYTSTAMSANSPSHTSAATSASSSSDTSTATSGSSSSDTSAATSGSSPSNTSTATSDSSPSDTSADTSDSSSSDTSAATSDSSSSDTSAAEADNYPSLSVKARSSILIDANSQKILYAENPHEKLPPASVTKIMTMLLICEAIDSGRVSLDDVITVSDKAAGMGGSQMYMEPGETHTLNELLTGISMISANDACVAAAEHISGSSEIFVEEMNRRASDLGMNDTHFANTNGLPVADHYTSAYDIALMSAELLRHDIILPYLSNGSGTAKVGRREDRQTTLEMLNTNKLLRTYNGAIGIKTGFTQDAGYCLAAAAERNNLRLISVVLGCESSKIRFSEASRLLDYGYSSYEAVQIADKNEIIGSATVNKGIKTFTDLRTAEKIQVLVPKGSASSISYSVVPSSGLNAPVKEGQTAGKLIIKQNGEAVSEYILTADTDVKKAGFKILTARCIESFMRG